MNDISDAPQPTIDPDVERAPGGADASSGESDVGSGDPAGELLTPDQPLAAQQDHDDVPDEIQEPESSDQAPDEESGAASGERPEEPRTEEPA